MRVQLGGYVMDDDTARVYRRYKYTGVCCPEDVRQAIAACPEGEELVFEINSGGGSVYKGFEMYTLLRNAGKETVAEIQSVAASAATLIAIGCKTVRISPIANMMIHRASVSAEGNSEDMAQAGQMLNTIDESILTAYAERAGDKCDREKLRAMMEAETFLTADEAIACGLADEKLYQEENRMEAIARSAVAMAGEMPKIMAALPPIDELRRRGNGDEIQNNGKPEEKEETKLTLEELTAQAPELLAEIQKNAATAERERIKGIEAMGMPGFEDLIDSAKEDPQATGESVAVKIVARQKQQGKDFLKDRGADAGESGVNGVEGSDGQGKTDALEAVLKEVFG